jgi:hypothetical protein
LPLNRDPEHWQVKAVFYQRPPEILQERPETIRGLGKRNTMRKDAVQMGVGIDKAGGQHLPFCAQDCQRYFSIVFIWTDIGDDPTYPHPQLRLMALGTND